MSPLSTTETTERDMSLTRGGMSTGVNVSPGTDDDGWNTPPPVELADGSRVELYKDGEALHAAYNAIESARRTICLEIYIFHSDRTGKAFAELLRRRAREGLTVRVIYDSVGSFDTDRALFESMRTAGVHLREFHPVVPWHTRHAWRPFNRDHRKLLVVDDVFAALGGQNLGDEYGSSWVLREPGTDDCWRDTG